MALPPLSHHEILSLVAPFAARGRHVDLSVSDRLARRLAFRPIEHAAGSSEVPPLCETLQLQCFARDHYRLKRVLHDAVADIEVTSSIDGSDPAELLARIEAIDPHSQFQRGRGFVLGLSYDLKPVRGQIRPVLLSGEARAGGVKLMLQTSSVAGMPADLELHALAGDRLELPEDLLAVLGWAWRRLVRRQDEWRSLLRLRRWEPARSRDAERKLRLAAEHLARTLAESPQRFHERLLRARWAVTFRRALPLLFGIGLLVAVAQLRYTDLPEDSVMRMMLFHLPAVLMLLFLSLHETPRIEIPPLPKRPTAPSWRVLPETDTRGTS
jgi:hypothetical protein